MPLFTWDDKLSVGITKMDEHHRKLVSMINDLHDAMKEGRGKDLMAPMLKGLLDYANFHFSSEEAMMQKMGFADLESHKAEHEKFIQKVNAFNNDLNKGKLALSMDVMVFLKDWLLNHILKSDKQYARRETRG
jgi:hemerythrin